MDFRNRTVVVTGGIGALGSAVIGALLAAGAHCRIPYLIAREAEAFPHRGSDHVTLVADCDLTDEADVGRLYEGAAGLWASIQIAGGFASGSLAETDKAALMAMIETNLLTCHLCCRAAVRAMSAGSGSGGRIVNVAARPALEPRTGAGAAAYTASKAAVAALTQALAEEVAGQDILVNAVAPSVIDTPANRSAMPAADHARWATPEAIAATIAFLASPENKVTRGGVIPVYGRAG
ncbi:MAG: SDR family NAD(P)-dependent oxidoreductase [Pseudomonadota bacterium]|nr:SDR family NAD(P)-dependent oxidoreductase [Pseudomonadota bacterium]